MTKSNLVLSGYLIVNTLLTLNRLVVELVHKSKGIKKVGLVMAWDFLKWGRFHVCYQSQQPIEEWRSIHSTIPLEPFIVI